MKKLNKLFAILIAVLSVGSLSAQTWTASDVSAGTYYLYNVGADKFLCSGNNWGSHASVTEGGIPVTLAGSGNVYTISTAAIYADKYLNEVWMDGGSYDWTFEKVSDKVYKLKNGSNVLYWNGGTSTNTTFGTDPGTTASQWMLVTEEARVAALANATQGSPIDATFLIKNAYFAKGNGRIVAKDADLTNSPSWKGTTLTDLWGRDWGTEEACYAVEQYGKQFDNYQELTVPNGKYFMTAKGFYRGSTVPYIYANSEKCNLKVKGDIGGDNMTNGAIAMFGNDYLLDGVNVVVTNGNLRVGVKSDSWMEWCVFDDFKLIYYGKDLTLYENALSNAITTAQSIDKAKLNTAISNNLSKEITNSQAALNDANKTVESLEKQATSLNAIIETANNSIAPYATLSSLIDLCTEYTQNSNANSTDALTTFQTAINTATTNGNAATSADAINAAHNTLESARQTYARNAVPVYPYPFDMTFMLPNTTFDSNTEGWTQSGGAGWMSAGNVECYNKTFEFSMEYEGLNQGSWEIQVDAFYRYGGYDDAEKAHNGGTEQLLATLYANNNTVAVKSIMEGANAAGDYGQKTAGGVYVPNWPDQCDTYFATGCYTNAIATVIADGKLKVGIKKETIQASDWTIFDNFKLIYKGIDVTDLQNALSALITTAYAIKEEKMGTAESAALNTALDNADATVTNADRLSEMISNLQSAYDDAVASISTYAAVSAYIAKANSIHTSIAASYQAQYDNGTIESDAETVRQALNVATYEYVKEEFGNEIVLTDWGAASNAMWSESGEHWDGTTGEGCTSYYDASGTNTTHTLSKTVELTSGTYIFRGAGRSNTNTTLSLSIDIDGIEPVIFNSKGNTGRGIDKEGKATFADEAQYAKDGQGQGWEWEFIKFTLNETTIVTLTATCKTSGWGWASFANNGLWMDDATYVVANAGAITAPKAAALALVGTKPMGAAEDEALSAAIAQANETLDTPAKLDGAIAVLETAVANANKWVVDYNAAKAPLIAALERFETDFNNGENGALYPMSDEAWNTLLTAVGTAAKAKDVTDSYASFAIDAETFNRIMDASESSIILYKKWAGLITSVQAYYDNIKQDAALNTAISTASAESSKATDASLTSATEALNAAYQEALDGDFDASIFLGDNLDFESGKGTALDELVFEIPGWDIEYDGNVNENARIQPETYGESNAIRIRSNWEDAPTTMRVYKEVVLPSGSYNLSMTLLTSIAGSGVNLTYYELNGERTMLSSDTYKKVTAPSIELEEPTILLLSLGLTGTTGNNAQELYADSIALACNAKTLYQRTLEGIKALAEDGEPTLVITNVYNEYKDKEGSLTAEQKATAIAVMNNAISIDAADDMVTSLIKNADFTGGTNSYSVQGSGGQVQAPKEWTFGYTFEGWNDTKVTDGYFNLWAGVIKYGELSQVINNLPNGTYKLTADVVTSSTDGSSIVAIYGAPANGNIARSKNADNSDDYLNYEVYFKVVDNQATIGARTDNHYFKLKNIQLEYVEDDAVAVDNGILYQAAFINRGNTTWDITEITPNASEASIYMSSPNALIIANEGQVSNVNNVIVDGTAASFVLNDGGYAFNATTDFTATALNYAREFTKDTWLTVCLPFTYAIPENVKVETLSEIDTDTKTFTFDEVKGTMEANKPYIIKNSTETAALFASLSNTAVAATPETMNVTVNGSEGEFIGTYTTMSSTVLMEDGTYDILFFGTDGQLYYLSQGVTTKVITFKPFRAYVRLPKGAINWSDGQQARVRHRAFGEETDIENTESTFLESEIIYDLMGRKVTTMEKGKMYIVNGKKVIR